MKNYDTSIQWYWWEIVNNLLTHMRTWMHLKTTKLKEARDKWIYPGRPFKWSTRRGRRLLPQDWLNLLVMKMSSIFIVAVYTFVKIQIIHLKSVISEKLIIKMNDESELTILVQVKFLLFYSRVILHNG